MSVVVQSMVSGRVEVRVMVRVRLHKECGGAINCQC